MSIEQSTLAIKENKFLMQLVAEQKTLGSNPTLDYRIKGMNYPSVKAQCEQYFKDNTIHFDKNQVIAETRTMISRGQVPSEWPHLAAVFLIDAQAVATAATAKVDTLKQEVAKPITPAPVLAPAATVATPASSTAPVAAPTTTATTTPVTTPSQSPAPVRTRPAGQPSKMRTAETVTSENKTYILQNKAIIDAALNKISSPEKKALMVGYLAIPDNTNIRKFQAEIGAGVDGDFRGLTLAALQKYTGVTSPEAPKTKKEEVPVVPKETMKPGADIVPLFEKLGADGYTPDGTRHTEADGVITDVYKKDGCPDVTVTHKDGKVISVSPELVTKEVAVPGSEKETPETTKKTPEKVTDTPDLVVTPNARKEIDFGNGVSYAGQVTSIEGKDIPNGIGIMKYADGSEFRGIWKDGKIFTGEILNKAGELLEKYENGKKKEATVAQPEKGAPDATKKAPETTGTPKIDEKNDAVKEAKDTQNSIYAEVDTMLASKGLAGRFVRNTQGVWQDAKGGEFQFAIDPESGNIIYGIERKSAFESNSKLSELEQDILNNVSAILKKRGMNAGQVKYEKSFDHWGKTILGGLGLAGAALAWKKWGKKTVTKEVLGIDEKVNNRALANNLPQGTQVGPNRPMGPDGRRIAPQKSQVEIPTDKSGLNPPKTIKEKQAERVQRGKENLGRDVGAEKAERKSAAEAIVDNKAKLAKEADAIRDQIRTAKEAGQSVEALEKKLADLSPVKLTEKQAERAQRGKENLGRDVGAEKAERKAAAEAIVDNKAKLAKEADAIRDQIRTAKEAGQSVEALEKKLADLSPGAVNVVKNPEFPTKTKALEWWNGLSGKEKISAVAAGGIVSIAGITYVVTPSGDIQKK